MCHDAVNIETKYKSHFSHDWTKRCQQERQYFSLHYSVDFGRKTCYLCVITFMLILSYIFTFSARTFDEILNTECPSRDVIHKNGTTEGLSVEIVAIGGNYKICLLNFKGHFNSNTQFRKEISTCALKIYNVYLKHLCMFLIFTKIKSKTSTFR
jgi:hypothetical protein